jgi:hypothetical protein
MRTYRLALFVPIAVAALLVAACGNNDSAKTEAPVVLTTNSTLVPGYANIASPSPSIEGYPEVVYPTLIIQSKGKSPTAILSSQDDAILNQWVITPSRSDGGTVASPQWQNFITIYVPAGGTTSLSNFPIYPAEYFQRPPLLQLFPQNGGFDKETGQTVIRERLHVEIFGKTVAGKSVSVAFDVDINFYYCSAAYCPSQP